MSSPAQITANRANAQFSTGPRSVEGKAASSRNALKLGIHAESMVIPGEDPEALAALIAAYEADLRPEGPVETGLVQTLVRCDWMQRRLYRIEAQVTAALVGNVEEPGDDPLGQAYLDDAAGARVLQTIARRLQSLQRDYFRALKEIKEISRMRTEAHAFSCIAAAASAPTDRVRFSPAPATPTPAPRPVPDNPALRL